VSANRNQRWARTYVDELARAGVRDVCIAPGSRSTPLVLAVAADERLRTFVQLDERSAGFFALGIGKATGTPAAVITTSGTAPANLFPAVIEAAQSEVPLLVLSADRPLELRGADANQAIDQTRLFGPYVRRFFEVGLPRVEGRPLRHLRQLAGRAMADALGPPGGPVHVNLAFEKPLEPTPVPEDEAPGFAERHPRAAEGREAGEPYTSIGRAAKHPEPVLVQRAARRIKASLRGLIVAGPGWGVGDPAVFLGERTGFPILADPLSGARFGPGAAHLVPAYDLILRDRRLWPLLRPGLVIRLGASPTSQPLKDFLEDTDADQIVIDPGDRWKDHLASACHYLVADPALAAAALGEAFGAKAPSPAAEPWRRLWERVGEIAQAAVQDQITNGPAFEGGIAASLFETLDAESIVFASNSMPIRDIDAFVAPTDKRIVVMGNRGASGIDGIVSTALGASVGAGRPVVALLGDLAFYHDMNGLLATRHAAARAVFVVVNNDGGGIFHMLPIRQYEPAFTEYFATPHGLDFHHVAALYDLPWARVDVDEVGGAVQTALHRGTSAIVEVSSDRDENQQRHAETVAAVSRALRREFEIDQ
jgi:2-succinyl-5-enolpyruvyl-6-hydroxy-3-cyclohexene-1-carboxylate synthase